MSFDSPSYQPESVAHVLKSGQIGQERVESERTNETSDSIRTQKLLAEAYIFIFHSRLLGNDPNIAGTIRTELEKARDTNNTELLEQMITTLKEERRFTLDYMRQFANKDAENIPIYQLQAEIQQAFIEKMVYSRERQENINPDIALRDLYRSYQLT